MAKQASNLPSDSYWILECQHDKRKLLFTVSATAANIVVSNIRMDGKVSDKVDDMNESMESIYDEYRP